jgi:hypothetical protein
LVHIAESFAFLLSPSWCSAKIATSGQRGAQSGRIGPVEQDVRTQLTARLADRGLEIKTYDGTTLTLDNPGSDAAAEEGQPVDENELSRYAREAIRALPVSETMFPGLQEIVVDFGAI